MICNEIHFGASMGYTACGCGSVDWYCAASVQLSYGWQAEKASTSAHPVQGIHWRASEKIVADCWTAHWSSRGVNITTQAVRIKHSHLKWLCSYDKKWHVSPRKAFLHTQPEPLWFSWWGDQLQCSSSEVGRPHGLTDQITITVLDLVRYSWTHSIRSSGLLSITLSPYSQLSAQLECFTHCSIKGYHCIISCNITLHCLLLSSLSRSLLLAPVNCLQLSNCLHTVAIDHSLLLLLLTHNNSSSIWTAAQPSSDSLPIIWHTITTFSFSSYGLHSPSCLFTHHN